MATATEDEKAELMLHMQAVAPVAEWLAKAVEALDEASKAAGFAINADISDRDMQHTYATILAMKKTCEHHLRLTSAELYRTEAMLHGD